MKRKVFLILLLLLAAAGGIYYYVWHEMVPKVQHGDGVTDFMAVYEDIADDLAAAKVRLKEGKMANIVVRDLREDKQVALVIEGLPERTETMRLLDVLSRHKVKALFLIEGDNAVQQPETLRAIVAAGQDIGNYTYVGLRRFQDLPQEAMLEQLLRTQKAFEVLMGRRAAYFRSPQLKLTPTVRQNVYVAGIDTIVWPNVFMERNTLQTDADADVKAAEILPGSIISFPGGEPVEPMIQQVQKLDERPAIDKQPTIPLEVPKGTEPAKKRQALAEEVDRLLMALTKRGFSFSSVRFFRQIDYVAEDVPVPGKEAASHE